MPWHSHFPALLSEEYTTHGTVQIIVYWYFSKAGKMICNFRDEYENEYGEEKIHISNTDIDAKAGWNKIFLAKTGMKIKASTDNILTTKVRWTLL